MAVYAEFPKISSLVFLRRKPRRLGMLQLWVRFRSNNICSFISASTLPLVTVFMPLGRKALEALSSSSTETHLNDFDRDNLYTIEACSQRGVRSFHRKHRGARIKLQNTVALFSLQIPFIFSSKPSNSPVICGNPLWPFLFCFFPSFI